jgi:DNA-binding NarL/FixJ family response regulator
LLHTHAPHVYGGGFSTDTPAEKDVDRLAPRLRPIFRYLLQGDAEKEVAAKLKLSIHTVHRYTQAIYREFDVHSRGELLARYARSA